MRIRIASHPPLPVLKAWFGIDDHTAATQTILDLKKALSEQLCQLGRDQLQLELEGFELLDESLCYHVLREGDLINVRQISLANSNNKRKSAAISSEPAEGDRSSKRTKLSSSNFAKDSSSSSSSDESESSSETETESSSSDSSESSESTTSSGSDSSTSSSSSGPPSVETILPPTSASKSPFSSLAARRLTPLPRDFVPPGQGKASTRDRNRRRRLARKYKLASTHGSPAVPNPTQSAPSLERAGTPKTFTFTAPLPASSVHPAPIQMSPEPLMMMSLKNSNKRKGYKERLTGSSGPKKLVFCDPDASRSPDVPPEPDLPPPTPRASRKPKLSHLIPPSEAVDLPANMFVTSIDVEADLWQQRPGTKRAKTTVSNADKADKRRSSHGHEERTGFAPQFEEDVILNYGDPEDTNIREQIPDFRPHKVDWDAVESDFRSLPKIDVGNLSVGAVVAWQALGIDSSSLTPAMLLHLGEVLSVSEDAIEVGLFQRPNSAKTIGFGLRFGQDEFIEDQDEPEVLVCRIEDAKDWKLVQPPPTKV